MKAPPGPPLPAREPARPRSLKSQSPLAKADQRSAIVRLCHALSDETRLRVLNRLLEGECCVCDLTDTLDTAQSRLSFHLKTLRDAGLVEDRREGRWVYYTLSQPGLAELKRFVDTFAEAFRASPSGGCCSR